MAYKGLTVEFRGDTTSLSKALKSARSEMSGMSKELRQLQRGLKLDPGNTRLVAQQQAELKRGIKATREELDALEAAERELASLDHLTPEQERQWRQLQSDIVLAEQRLRGYSKQLIDSIAQQELATSKLNAFGDALAKGGSRLQTAGELISKTGDKLSSTVTTGIIAAGAATVAAAVTIDDSLTGVRKTVDGTEEQYQELKQAAVEFSKTNAVDASQILGIQALGAQLGFAIEELDEFGQIVSGLDIATNMDAETAATEMAQFANITKMSHEAVSNYGSAIVGLGNNFATTEADISSMAMRLAAAGTQVGMSQADILGLATALSSMGMEAEAGGTAMSTIMATIDKAVAQATDGLQAYADQAGMSTDRFIEALNKNAGQFKDLADSNGTTVKKLQSEVNKNLDTLTIWAETAGMSAETFAAAWKEKPVEALAAVLSNMEKTTAEGGNMSVMLDELGITSLRQTDAMKRLAGNSQFVTDAVAKSNEEWEKNTALQAEVDNRNSSLSAQFDMLKNRAIAIAESVGGPVANALLEALDATEPLIQAIADGAQAFSDMDEEQQRIIIGALALAAAFGPTLSITGRVVTVTGKLTEALGKGAKASAERAARSKAEAAASKAMADASLKEATASKAATTASKAKAVAGKTAAAETAAVGNASKGAASGITAEDAAARKAATGTKGFGAALKSLTVGNVLAILSLLATVFGAIAGAIEDARQKQETYQKSTDGLVDSIDAVNDAIGSAAKALDATTTERAQKSMRDLRTEIDENIRAQAELADAMTERWGDINGNSAVLQGFMGTIDALTAKYDENGVKIALTAEEQAQLATAIAGVNEICGTTISMIDAQNGILSESTAQIHTNTDAWIAQAKAQAAQEELVDLAKQQLKNEEALTEAKQQHAAAEAYVNSVREAGYPITQAELQQLADCEQALHDTQAEYDSNAEAQQRLTGKIAEATAQLSSSKDAIATYISSQDGWRTSLNEAGVDVDAFAQKLSMLGYSTADLSAMSTEQLMVLAQNYQLSAGEIIAVCDEMGVQVPERVRLAAQGATEAIAAETPSTAAAAASTADAVEAETSEMSASMQTDAQAGAEGATAAIAAETPNAQNATSELVTSVSEASSELPALMANDGASGTQQMADGITSGQGNAVAAADTVSKQTADHLSSSSRDAWFAGNNMTGQSFTQGVEAAVAISVAAADRVSKLVADHFSSANGDAWWAGYNMTEGMANGVTAGTWLAVNAARQMARNTINAAKDEAKINSPSKEMIPVGGAYPEGTAVGIIRKTYLAVNAARQMAARTVRAGSMGATNKSLDIRSSSLGQTASQASRDATTVRLDTSAMIGKTDMYDAVGSAVMKAMRSQGDIVIKCDEREVARLVRRYAA